MSPCAAFAFSTKACVPDLAMVPRFSTSSVSLMPMPVSAMVSVFAVLVGRDGDLEIGSAFEQLGLGDRLVAQLVERVGGIGDQLAQEHVAVGIDRMHHEVQELGDFRLESVGPGRAMSGAVCCCRGIVGHVTLFLKHWN